MQQKLKNGDVVRVHLEGIGDRDCHFDSYTGHVVYAEAIDLGTPEEIAQRGDLRGV